MPGTIDKLKMTAAVALVVAGLAAFYALEDTSQLVRVALLIVSIIAAAGIALTSVYGQDAWEFAKGARGEFRKIVWPTRRETATSTMIVLALVVLIGLFLWMLDTISFWLIYDLVLQIGRN